MSSGTFTFPKTFKWSCGNIIDFFKKIDKVSVNDLHLPDFYPMGILYMYLDSPFQHQYNHKVGRGIPKIRAKAKNWGR